MRLRGKLDNLVAEKDSKEGLLADLRFSIEQQQTPPKKRRRQRQRRILHDLPGEAVECELGTVQLVRHTHDKDRRHGHVRVDEGLRAARKHVSKLAIDDCFADVDLRHALYVDTETTGLAGGTGTVPFLIGMGWFDDEGFHVWQGFLPNYADEMPLLGLLKDRIEQASCVVTFNGKSFDWPLLQNRFVLNRLSPPELPPHLDLLHCSRRVYKHRFHGSRLVDLEEYVLGHVRQDDLDGGLIPEVYFEYLGSGDGALIRPIIDHNHDDILALPCILGAIGAAFRYVHQQDASVGLALAQLATRTGDAYRAEKILSHVVQICRDDDLTIDALCLLALCLKRRDKPYAAARRYREALGLTGCRQTRAEIHLSLSKLYEHKLRDVKWALRHAKKAKRAQTPEDYTKRVSRLEAKK